MWSICIYGSSFIFFRYTAIHVNYVFENTYCSYIKIDIQQICTLTHWLNISCFLSQWENGWTIVAADAFGLRAKVTPWKINMEPQNRGFGTGFFLFSWVTFRFKMIIFQGCIPKPKNRTCSSASLLDLLIKSWPDFLQKHDGKEGNPTRKWRKRFRPKKNVFIIYIYISMEFPGSLNRW